MVQTIHFDGVRWTCRADASSAQALSSVLRLPAGGESTIVIRPPAGGSVLVEFSASSVGDIAAGEGLFAPAEGLAPGGVVRALTLDNIPSTITALRLTASDVGARVEVAQ